MGTLENLEKYGYTALVFVVFILPLLIGVTRWMLRGLANRDIALKEQRDAHNADRKSLVAMFQKQIEDERAYSAKQADRFAEELAIKDQRLKELNDRTYEQSTLMVAQAKDYATSVVTSVEGVRRELMAELVSLGARMRAAESLAERAEREAAQAKIDAESAKLRDIECQRRLGDLEMRFSSASQRPAPGPTVQSG